MSRRPGLRPAAACAGRRYYEIPNSANPVFVGRHACSQACFGRRRPINPADARRCPEAAGNSPGEGWFMTSAGHLQERPGPAQALPGAAGAARTPFDDVADWAARLPWCGPVLLTLALGFYQAGRPELWRDEVASWWFASRPLPRLIAAVHSTGATQLPYYLLLHFWIAAFGDSASAMRALSTLAMAGVGACVPPGGRRVGGRPGRPDLGAGVRPGAERVPVRSGDPVLRDRGPGRDAGHAAPAAGSGPGHRVAVGGLRRVPGGARLRRPRRPLGDRGARRRRGGALAAGPG